ncbi:MAB_1171c family putative transporter [Streptomyces boncukensis]
MERSVGYWACAVPLWLVFASKAIELTRAWHDPMRRAVCATLLSCAAIPTLTAPAAMGAVNDLSGVPNLGIFVVFSLGITLAASVQVLVVYWQEPDGQSAVVARRWIAGYGGVLLGMSGLFWAGEAPVERRTDFETFYADTPYISEFVLLYLTAQAVAMVSVSRRCLRWARLAGDPWLRRGLRLIATGAAFGAGMSVARGLAMAARWLGGNWDVLNTRVSVLCTLLGLLLGVLGFALPAWAGHLVGPREALRSYRGYRELYPLWNALRTAVPTIVLPARIPWWSVQLRLTRRLAEINDGRLVVWPLTDQRVALRARRLGRQAGLSAAEQSAAVEAALLKGALDARRAGADGGSAKEPPPEPADPVAVPGGLSELEWLTLVGRAFAGAVATAAALPRSTA